MTRTEYIEALSAELDGFDDESRRDILLEIEDHIDELTQKHSDMNEEAIIADLEKPDILGECLRKEAGVESTVHASTDGRKGKGKAKITIDGEDLEDVIKRALDVARLFKGSTLFREMKKGSGAQENPNERRVRFNDIPVDDVKHIIVNSKAADLRVLVSNSGFSLMAEGEEDTKFSVEDNEEGVLEVSTGQGRDEPGFLEVRVPCTVDLLSIRTVSGDVTVEDRVGDLDIHTASGDIEVEACSGSIRISTASGNVDLASCGEGISVQTASGDVEIELDELCSGVSVNSASGNVGIHYPDDFSATLRWSTVSGTVDHDCESSGPRTAVIGDGLVPIAVNTASGDIEIARI